MKKIFFIVTLLLSSISVTSLVSATNTGVNVKILPMDCVFNVVNVGGQQQIVYVTPEECGQVVTPVDPENPNSNAGQSGSSSSSTKPILNGNNKNDINGIRSQSSPWYFPTTITPNASVTPGIATRPSEGGIILLNLFPEYLREKQDAGKVLSLNAGQNVYFDYKGERYTITIVEVTSDSVSLLFTQVLSKKSNDLSVLGDKALHDILAKGATGEYELSTEKGAHIRITYLGTTNGMASLRFKEITQNSDEEMCSSGNPCWLWLFIIMLIINVFAFYLLFKKRRKDKEEEETINC